MIDIPPDISLFFGRFHPLLVHLPIGFLVLLACLEILSRSSRFHKLTDARGSVLALTVPMAALSALCGCLLARGGGYDASLLEWHLWAGLGVAGGCLLALMMHWRNWRTAYDAVLAATLIGLLVASHGGGSLTHGKGYLTRYLPALERLLGGGTSAAEPAAQPVAPAVAEPVVAGGSAVDHSAFATLVQPLLTAKCVSCHGPDQARGGLRLDSLDAMINGPKFGPALVPGDSAASEMSKRFDLPPDNETRMPPPGQAQLTPDEIALVRWWIDAGAPGDKTAAELKLATHLQHFLAANPAPATAAANPAAVTAAATAAPPRRQPKPQNNPP